MRHKRSLLFGTVIVVLLVFLVTGEQRTEIDIASGDVRDCRAVATLTVWYRSEPTEFSRLVKKHGLRQAPPRWRTCYASNIFGVGGESYHVNRCMVFSKALGDHLAFRHLPMSDERTLLAKAIAAMLQMDDGELAKLLHVDDGPWQREQAHDQPE